jgi:hypothetical protein
MRRVTWLFVAAVTGACTYDGAVPDDEPGDDTPPTARYVDCADAFAQGETTSAVYTIEPDDAGAFDVYCNMELEGGGWTLAIKADGSAPTFEFDSPLWDSQDAYNAGSPDHDHVEAMLPSYAHVAADEILIETASSIVRINPGGNEPLWGHVTGSSKIVAPVGLGAWKALVPGSELFDDCLWLEGTNFDDDEYAARIGAVAYGGHWDEGNLDCSSSYDGSIGVGLWTNDTCDSGPTGISVGNINDGCSMPVFAYVYVRN